MKLHICYCCRTLRNEQCFLVRHGQGAYTHEMCKSCRNPMKEGRWSCKTRLCPCCNKLSPNADFFVFSQGQPPVERLECTLCRWKAKDRATYVAVNGVVDFNRDEAAPFYLLDDIEELFAIPEPPFIRLMRWLTQPTSKR